MGEQALRPAVKIHSLQRSRLCGDLLDRRSEYREENSPMPLALQVRMST
jgi:hypothetical protein